jgi:hypothetical protein
LPNGRPPDERAVERLAKRLYDDSESGASSWLRLGWDKREIWLNQAREALTVPRSSFDWLYFWRPARIAAPPHHPKGDDHGKRPTAFESRSQEAEAGRSAQSEGRQGFAFHRTAGPAGAKASRRSTKA